MRTWGAALLVAAVLAGCAGEDGRESDLREAVEAYSNAFLSGDSDAAYDLLSERCRERITRTEFDTAVRLANDQYGSQSVETYSADVNGDQARVTYTYADTPEINQQQEPWVHEDGTWRQDDC